MTIATSLVNAARTLIETFGNNASRYTFSSATKTYNDEGEVNVTGWGTAATIKVIDGSNQGQELKALLQGKETMGEDEKIIKDNATVALNDRVTYNGKDYRVTDLRTERIQSTTIIQIIKLSEAVSTTTWM